MNSIVGIPTIKAWKIVFDFESDTLVARGINTKFRMICEATKQGLPIGVNISQYNFVRPVQDPLSTATALLKNIDSGLAPATVPGITPTPTPSTIVI